jgi:hypothetical protein
MRGAGGHITLTDFGTSKDLSRDQRRLAGDFAGTPLFLAAIIMFVAPWRDGASPSACPAASAAAPAPPAGGYRVDAAVYREVDGVDQKLEAGARLSIGDRLALHLPMSVPAYVHVVNEDEMGDSYLLFPIEERTDVNPLPGGTADRLPSRSTSTSRGRYTSSGIREHFLSLAIRLTACRSSVPTMVIAIQWLPVHQTSSTLLEKRV